MARSNTPTANKRTNTKVAAMENVKKEEVLTKVKELSPDKTGAIIANAQNQVLRQFSEISASLAEQQQVLKVTQDAIEIKKKELADIYDVSDSAVSKAELEDQITLTREAWNRERLERDRQWQEEAQENQKARKRELDDYNYTYDQTRKQNLQKLNDEIANLKKSHGEKVEAIEKDLAARQQTVAAAEKELADLRAQGATFEARVAKDVKTQTDSAVAAISRQLNHEKKLVELEAEKKIAMAEAARDAATQQVASLRNMLEAAERKIDGLQADVKAISTTALGAQAGKEALAAVQQFQQNSAQGTAKPTR
jgi:chromosome segregation ATPase